MQFHVPGRRGSQVAEHIRCKEKTSARQAGSQPRIIPGTVCLSVTAFVRVCARVRASWRKFFQVFVQLKELIIRLEVSTNN